MLLTICVVYLTSVLCCWVLAYLSDVHNVGLPIEGFSKALLELSGIPVVNTFVVNVGIIGLICHLFVYLCDLWERK